MGGIPAMYAAYVRPDVHYTSEVTGVAWMDTTLLKASLYEGRVDSGFRRPLTQHVARYSAAATTSLVAAFNSGFLMQDAQGGYYADGHTAIPLR